MSARRFLVRSDNQVQGATVRERLFLYTQINGSVVSGMAIRNPKRGKAHKPLGRWNVTVCRDTSSGLAFFRSLTEQIPVERTAPEDRCRKCWPT